MIKVMQMGDKSKRHHKYKHDKQVMKDITIRYLKDITIKCLKGITIRCLKGIKIVKAGNGKIS